MPGDSVSGKCDLANRPRQCGRKISDVLSSSKKFVSFRVMATVVFFIMNMIGI